MQLSKSWSALQNVTYTCILCLLKNTNCRLNSKNTPQWSLSRTKCTCSYRGRLLLGMWLTHSLRNYGGSGLCNMETDKQGYTVKNHQGVIGLQWPVGIKNKTAGSKWQKFFLIYYYVCICFRPTFCYYQDCKLKIKVYHWFVWQVYQKTNLARTTCLNTNTPLQKLYKCVQGKRKCLQLTRSVNLNLNGGPS